VSTYNPFSSDFLRSGADDRLRPQGKLAYVAGATDDPLKFMTIPQLLDRACARHGGRTAVIFAANGVELSWYDLRQRSNDVAAGLLALGIGRGDRVGIWAPNRAEWLYVQFGTARIGANPCQYQSGVSDVGARIRAQKGRMQGAGHGEAPQVKRLPRNAARARA
jgi:acyl-coenzyme A synthetase/AMP-(fatty) acid ligase